MAGHGRHGRVDNKIPPERQLANFTNNYLTWLRKIKLFQTPTASADGRLPRLSKRSIQFPYLFNTKMRDIARHTSFDTD
jgi:hypothetical protein